MIKMRIKGNELFWERHGLSFRMKFKSRELLNAAVDKYRVRRQAEGIAVTIEEE